MEIMENRVRRLFHLLPAIAFFTVIPYVQAVEIGEEELEITLDFTYASKYMWHGYDIYDDHGSFQPSIQFGYQGFYALLWGAWPDASGFEDLTEIDLALGYQYTLFEDTPFTLDTQIAYTYFTYPKINSDGDAQEVFWGVSLPRLIPVGPSFLVPGYTVFYDWEGVQGGNKIDDGWFHTLSLSYDIPIPHWLPGQEDPYLSLSSDLTYNDGAFASDSGWSHATIGVSTTAEWRGFYFTPALYYQFSFEDTVNPEDDFYMLFSIGYAF